MADGIYGYCLLCICSVRLSLCGKGGPCRRGRRNYNKEEDEESAAEVEPETWLQRGLPPMTTNRGQPEAYAMQPPVFNHKPESDGRTFGRDMPQFQQERTENAPNLNPYQP
ncbi:hypothetical protein GALMADRAFT_145282 [Galerina marginata CBS 339.88]|uniref:Uncharacterized protein n=1 Tax=Galerina marginata (strain CBS 339.88) TaxID=685588 RepID=A0A067SIT3_GALM3|nr:hypothetical protein GALMADRAFT_145282 [Galerina marginata CBS 339.88]